MTDHKFTDDELQRCIECCIKGKVWGDCKKLNCPAIRKQGCHFYLRTDDDYENTIYIEILKDALALINRQKAEIEKLKGSRNRWKQIATDFDKASRETEKEIERLTTLAELGNMGANDYREMRNKLKKANAEIERLKKIGDDKTSEVLRHDASIRELHKQLETAKSETIKEFAERLKAKEATHFCKCGRTFTYTDLFNGEIDTLVKEMTEGKND